MSQVMFTRASNVTGNSEAKERHDLMLRLYGEQVAVGDSYLASHGQPAAIVHHVNVYEWYAPFLRPGMTILDWGCNHGPDSCLLRHQFGDQIELHSCDFAPESSFSVFREYAAAAYKQLSDPFNLPYRDASFDAVIGSGVLEHTAMDGEALKEVYRTLRPGGLLVITYLPYAYSLAEWRQRNVHKKDYHHRRYTKSGLTRLLLTHGFQVQEIGLQGYVPNRLKRQTRPLWWKLLRPVLHPVIEKLWKPVLRPLRYPFFSQTVLCAVARKVVVM